MVAKNLYLAIFIFTFRATANDHEWTVPELLGEKPSVVENISAHPLSPCLNVSSLPPYRAPNGFNPAGDAENYRQFLISTVECVRKTYPNVESLRWLLEITKSTPFRNGSNFSCKQWSGVAAYVPPPFEHVEYCSSWPFEQKAIYGLGYSFHELIHVMQFKYPRIVWKNSDRSININPGRDLLRECQADQVANQLLIDAWGFRDFLNIRSYYQDYRKECESLARQNVNH